MKKTIPENENCKTTENLKFIESVKKDFDNSENISKYYRVEEVMYEIFTEPEDIIYGIK